MGNMSRLNKKKKVFLILIAVLITAFPLFAESETDDILTFYTQRAAQIFGSRNPSAAGVSYSITAKTYFKIYDKEKISQTKDSAISDYFFSFGELDSIVHIVQSQKKQDSLDFSYPNIFVGEYAYNFYPNDTGGSDLSIGFDSFEFNPEIPVGLAVIDRDRYFLRWLHLHYLNEKRVERESKSYRFVEHEGFIFPDSVWDLYAKPGVFSTEYYRRETSLFDIRIYR